MIQIHPSIEQKFTCPICKQEIEANKTMWQGIHVCVESECTNCQRTFYQDLKVGHSLYAPFSVDLHNFELFGSENSKDWYGVPLQKSLKNPNCKNVKFKKEIYANHDRVVILNCIDYLYGHSLLKLLNAEKHLKVNPEYGLIVILPQFLEWMLPKGIAEKWVFDISLKEGQEFFTDFNNTIQKEMKRFSEIHISKAFSHPKDFDITNFTGIEKHNFQKDDFRITFIWREDRLWINNSLLNKGINKLNITILKDLFLNWQKRKVITIFSELRKRFPDAIFTVAGFGNHQKSKIFSNAHSFRMSYKKFPKWIDNQIVYNFNTDTEKKLCQIYSDSRIVIGVHGSNMLLPSAHAGMTIDLMPDDRWGNFAQDILYQENDNRVASFKYRFLPISIKAHLVAKIAFFQVKGYKSFVDQMMN
ncbi:MAG: hypothetical protein HF967_04115 [Methanosarcinales archaeon]|nr:hypothetical protein [Methanosarcinales archaeon]